QILIVGGGNAGISVAAQLKRHDHKLEITIVEPSQKHYYQPAWSLVGGGVYDINDTVRDEASVIPHGVLWIPDFVEAFLPEENAVRTKRGELLSYDYMVV